MSARDEPIPQPLERLLGPNEEEVSCETCFARLDEYVELERSGADAEARIPGFAAHLRGCPACHEDHQSLHALLAGGEGGGAV